MNQRAQFKIFLCVACCAATFARAGEAVIVSHIGVLSNRVEDVSSLEAWKKSCIKDGMSDAQKALAVWQSVCKFRHQDPPPIEYITGDGGDVHDPIKTFNVYGYNMCCCEASNICALARCAGLRARGWGIHGHSVPELEYGGAWHLLDASLVCYFPKSDGQIAGVEEIISGIGEWYKLHPEYVNNNNLLYKFMGRGGWKKGPAVLASSSSYDDNGWLPAATHGWYSTMQEYDGSGGGAGGKAFQYEYGYSQGYEVNIQLRPGEKLTRNWGNIGLHVNMDLGVEAPGCLTEQTGKGQLRYSSALGDLSNGRIGNGTLEYALPLKDGRFKNGALSVENLACTSDDGLAPALHVKAGATEGSFCIDMPCSYVYLNGSLEAQVVAGAEGVVVFELSDNHGLDWKNVGKFATSGEAKLDLKPYVYRRYDYRLRVTLKGVGTGLQSLKLLHAVQHSQRPLPALDQGENAISFNAGASEGTLTIEASGSLEHRAKQLSFADFHPLIENMTAGMLLIKGGAGSVAFPLSTPGDLKRLRFGAFYRARDARDGFDYQVSFDNGKTYRTVDHAPGLTGNGQCKYVNFSEIPSGTKAALVRFSGTQRNTTMLSNFRIDADYTQPHGGFAPVKITYNWEENGVAKQAVHVAQSPAEKYTIVCASKPVMRSIVLEINE